MVLLGSAALLPYRECKVFLPSSKNHELRDHPRAVKRAQIFSRPFSIGILTEGVLECWLCL